MCSLGLLVKAASKTTINAPTARHSGGIRAQEGVTEGGEASSEDGRADSSVTNYTGKTACRLTFWEILLFVLLVKEDQRHNQISVLMKPFFSTSSSLQPMS